MLLPVIKVNNRYKKDIVSFGGLNKTPAAAEGEFSDCSGISHINKPGIGVRQRQDIAIKCENPDGLYFGSDTFTARGEKLYKGDSCVGDISHGKKYILEHNGFVLVFPDKKYYDVKNKKFGKIDASYTIDGAVFKDNKLTSPKEKYVKTTSEQTETFSGNEPILCYDSITFSGGEAVAKGYSQKNAEDLTAGTIFKNGCLPNEYKTVESTARDKDGKQIVKARLVKVTNEYENIFSDFRAGDRVEVENSSKDENNGILEIESINENEITFADKTFTEVTETVQIKISRKIPDFSSVCLYENRLWGCCENVIYASALGDPFNFYTYKGLSTDSFTVTSNTAQPFTACSAYTNSCLFFKSDGIYKMFGTKPANFQLVKSFGGGVSDDAKDSIVATPGSIMYKGTDGIYSCFGGVPVCVSDKLGTTEMKNACAGSDNRRYYIAFDGDNGSRIMYVYDMESALWSVYGETDITAFVQSGGKLYSLHKDGIYTFTDKPDTSARWSVTLSPINEGYYGKKAYCKLKLNLKMAKNTYITADVSYDQAPFERVAVKYADREKYLSIPLGAKRCSEIVIRISGKGDVLLLGIEREFNVG